MIVLKVILGHNHGDYDTASNFRPDLPSLATVVTNTNTRSNNKDQLIKNFDQPQCYSQRCAPDIIQNVR